MSRVIPTSIISHWNHRIENVKESSDQFYAEVERLLTAHEIKKLRCDRVKISEGGIFSANREYLQICRDHHVFYICAAPFGKGFFVSWWLGYVESGLMAWLGGLPIIGFFVRNFLQPVTYYKVDTGLMFQTVTHSAVTEALDKMLSGIGSKALSDVERKPVMRDFFAQMSAQ